jgi:hypothetical protein
MRATRRRRGAGIVEVVGQDGCDETCERLMRAAAQAIESSGSVLREVQMRMDGAVHGTPF